jgi:23S rRNA (guanosine2251-2'-O)-methyltransferase
MAIINLRGSSGGNRTGTGRRSRTERPIHDQDQRSPGQRSTKPRPPRDGQRPPRQRQGGGCPERSSGSFSKGRQRATPFLIKGELLYGRNAILETLRAGRRNATRLWVAEALKPDERIDEIIELARMNEVLLETVPRQMLDDQEPGINHQGVLLETLAYPYADLADVIEAEGNVLILDHLQDPQNFGTLLRAADAAGVAGVVIPSDRSASVSPAVVNSSAGAVEHLRIALVANLGNAIEKLEASGRWIVGLDSGAGSQDLFSTDIPTPAALVVGSEGSGLTLNIRKRCQLVVSLPMLGRVESLNASTAGSIALFDLVRRSPS